VAVLAPQERLTASEIKRQAAAAGFDLCGIAPATALPELVFLREWLDAGYGGEMEYLRRTAERRSDVRQVMPSARSVIVFGTIYNTDRPYSTEIADAGEAAIARYAWGDDYHVVIQARLERMVEWLRAESGAGLEARAYVDTGPVQERVYAQHAGLGWIGKNTCVINPSLGSWIFLGEVICSLDLPPDEPALDQCGTCTLCLEACPTQALVAPGVLDSNRCISYLTIEHRGAIDPSLAAGIGSHVYGCDICQEVCPWNATAPKADDRAWQARAVWDQPQIGDLVRMPEEALQSALEGSAMSRAKPAGIRRNIEIAAANLTRRRT